ncbi:hypothetical protein CHLRE_04g224826v5 [Chlamydomonas reinhardtii]|uniref:Uncharacterized protein n=1 Tax=Chlamydomonas reinhardtii TaxID=3055 RepID=A0A2K3DUI3_CHLRE|nr:uncharacterized protein CHLRE_04g224826v5 [Chlamydomonas reinhardtii]PNW84189.1 hypothetical protein CHLRE_04g224826v5 [Chlamydomonas reinhardtii]
MPRLPAAYVGVVLVWQVGAGALWWVRAQYRPAVSCEECGVVRGVAWNWSTRSGQPQVICSLGG